MSVQSGSYCECTFCGYKGYVYGIPSFFGVSAPYCNQCGLNSFLKEVKREAKNTK